jgi:hypothetical protein
VQGLKSLPLLNFKIMAAKKHLFSWTGYVATKLKTAVVANTAKATVVLTFSDVKPFTNAVAGEFSFSGKTVDTLTIDHAAKTVTIVVTVAWVNGNTISCVYNPTNKGATVTIPVTNNIA